MGSRRKTNGEIEEQANTLAMFFRDSIKQALKQTNTKNEKNIQKYSKTLLKKEVLDSLEITFKIAYLLGKGIPPKNAKIPPWMMKNL